MYILLGISLALAIFFVWNLLFSILTAFLLNFLQTAMKDWSARLRAKTIFTMRVLPAISGLFFVLAFQMPAYFIYEPEESKEIVSIKLGFLALISTIGVSIAVWRICGTWLATNNLLKNWLHRAERIQIESIEIPVFRINHHFPVVAVVGTIYPRLFIASQVLETLSNDELQATLQHEKGHLASRDNFKRNLLDISRSLLMPIRFGRNLDLLWTKNVETAADEFAAHNGGKQTALNLASALVKIARIVPVGSTPTMPQGSFLLEEANGDITWRVQNLISLGDSDFENRQSFSANLLFWALTFGLLAGTVFLVVDKNVFFLIHSVLESLVSII